VAFISNTTTYSICHTATPERHIGLRAVPSLSLDLLALGMLLPTSDLCSHIIPPGSIPPPNYPTSRIAIALTCALFISLQ